MKSLIALAVLFNAIYAQSNTGSVITLTGSNSASATGADYATGTYVDYDTTYTLNTDNSYLTLTGTLNATATSQPRNETITTNGTVLVTSSATQTILSGRPRNSTTTTDGTNTSAAARPTNTTPCNGWPEFCNRKYSNISMVAAHNSPFLIAGNIASNQALPVTSQLNDGVRMLQFQVHRPNSTGLYLCHTSCDLLNAGLLVDYLTTVRQWLDENPYEVLTILMGNYDVLTPQNFTAPIIDSGLIRYVYTPPSVPMTLEQWPTLGEMILTNKRLVVMLDYEADQTEIPWLLDEFGQMWETPFSPTDPAFPCIVNRPPDQNRNISSNRMYMANHNLNIDVSIAGFSLLIPAFTSLNVTNGLEGYGSLGYAVDNCTTSWDRPPNFLLVDFYNIGSFNGSVFQVAATANEVDYNRASCCDTDGNVSNAAIRAEALSKSTVAIVLGVVALMFAL